MEGRGLAGAARTAASFAFGLASAAAGCGELVDDAVDDALFDVRIESFGARPQAVARGAAATLTYEVVHADDCRIDPDVGRVDADGGSVEVVPVTTTRYLLACERYEVEDGFRFVASRDEEAVTVEVR